MSYLLIDAGNSRLKWLYGNSIPGIVEAVSYRDNWRRKLYLAWHLLPEPKEIAFSSVTHPTVERTIRKLALKLWQRPITTYVSQKHTPNTLTVAYDPAEKLGSDRYLAMLGARALYQQPLCVIGCGTAITLDAIDEKGNHLGGMILPGMRLAENALLQNTQLLTPMRWSPNKLGQDTASCISAGIHHALPAGIEQIITELEADYQCVFRRFVFGGDAMILFGNRANYHIEADLIFGGMLAHLNNI